MRDYKNVKVPKKYRTGNSRGSGKRVNASRGKRRQGKGASGIKAFLFNIVAFSVLGAGCWASWQGYRVITRAEMFQIAGVDIKGVRYLKDADLRNIVGRFTGQNIFRVDLEAAARQARDNPWIREVRIQRSLPHRITMSVVERVPHAIFETRSGRYLMDNEAMIIGSAGKEPGAKGLPVIAIKQYRARPGEPVTAESMPEALALIAEIEARGGWSPADITLRAESPESLSVVYAGLEFKIGSGNYAEKLRRLAEVMADVNHRGLQVAYVDLRSDRQAAVMQKKYVRNNAGSKNRERR